MTQARRLRDYIQQQQILIAPGIFDGLSALLAEQAGFSILYASGGAIARSMGYPDIGLVTMTEVLATLARITAVSKLPVIADADTGFGGSLNVSRTIFEYERLGIAGLHIEDQTFPKRCGHLDDKSLISIEEMVIKIIAAKQAQTNPDTLIIARTDAIAVNGFEDAMKRGNAYLEAGADMIFVEAPETIQQIEAIPQFISGPKLINMFAGGKTPIVPLEKLKALGYQIVIIPSDLQRAAIMAMQNVLTEITKNGNSAAIENQLTSFKEREKIIKTEKYLNQDRNAAKHAGLISPK